MLLRFYAARITCRTTPLHSPQKMDFVFISVCSSVYRITEKLTGRWISMKHGMLPDAVFLAEIIISVEHQSSWEIRRFREKFLATKNSLHDANRWAKGRTICIFDSQYAYNKYNKFWPNPGIRMYTLYIKCVSFIALES